MARVPPTVFLLSPASLAGERARILLRDEAQFPLARALRLRKGVSLADVFTFLSGLYFRGKVTYARAFARPPRRTPGALVITSGAGLLDLDERVTADYLRELAAVPIALSSRRYLTPLLRDAVELHDACGPKCRVVLLGSIATGKYVEPLRKIFGERLLFPPAFVGRGDMSRGGLLLRCADAGVELDYVPIAGAMRHGARPARLPPRRRKVTNAPMPEKNTRTGRDLEVAVLIGLPGAGKSTFYSQRLAATHAHVSMDALGRSSDKRRRQRRLLEEALASKRSVAVDNVNATRTNRAELFELARRAGARVVGYWLDAAPGECAGRNRTRAEKARVPPAAIFGFAKRFEAPALGEGFAELWCVRARGTAENPTFELQRVTARPSTS